MSLRAGPPSIRPCSAGHDRNVQRLALAAYEERRLHDGADSARLTLLTDALEDTGCTDAELLGHLRGPGPHVVRGLGLGSGAGEEMRPTMPWRKATVGTG